MSRDELIEATARESARRAAVSAGEWLSGLRTWDLFGTMTYDPDRYQGQRTMFPWNRVPWAVSGERAKKDFLAWINDGSGALGRRIDFVAALEYQQNGSPHFHVLLDVGGLEAGDIVRIGRLWHQRHGYDRLEPPRSVADCAAYLAKHMGADLSKGDILFSKGVSEPRPRLSQCKRQRNAHRIPKPHGAL